jgi:protein-S-isoprenylcysteine O-methyltransferase Ste14
MELRPRQDRMNGKLSDIPAAFVGTTLFSLVLLPIFYIWIPYEIFIGYPHDRGIDIGNVRYIGLVGIVSGAVIYLWSACSFVFSGKGTPMPFSPTQQLVVAGLYRFVRNPIYIAGSLVLTGEALLFQSLPIFIYFLMMFAFFNVNVLMEETFLTDTFGSAYENYRASVPRWIPRHAPYRHDESGAECLRNATDPVDRDAST